MDNSFESQTAANRAALYHWFANAFFAPPTPAQVQDLQQGQAAQLLQALAATPGAAIGIQAMHVCLGAGSAARVAAELGAAHARLFYGTGGHETAVPYRSVYSSADGLLCQQATQEMERVLRQHRLRLQEAVCEPADHLSIQLEVMAQLALRYAEAAEQGGSKLALLQAEQADFLQHQLLVWLPDFSLRVIDLDDQGFYAGLASVLLCLAQQDLLFLGAATADCA
jgi:TorA-specific chaperone